MDALGGDALTRTQNNSPLTMAGNPLNTGLNAPLGGDRGATNPNSAWDGSLGGSALAQGQAQNNSIYNQFGNSSNSSTSSITAGNGGNNWPQPSYQAPGAYQDPENQMNGQYQTSIAAGGPIQNSIGNNQLNTGYIQPGQAAVHSVGGSNAYTGPAGDALYAQAQSRLDPQWSQRQQDTEAQLANMGLSRGSEAWNRESQNLGMQRNDAYNQAIWSAQQAQAQEANRLQGMDLNAGNFANAAAQQDYANQLTSQQAQNAALGQEFGQGLQQGQFANAAQAQGFGQNLSAAQLNNEAVKAGQANDIARQGLATQRYGTDVSSATQRYGADTSSAASRYGADQGLKSAEFGLQGSQAMAGASMANARYNADLANEQFNKTFGSKEDQRAFDNTRTIRYDPIMEQNMLLQGVPMPTNPSFNGYTGASAPQTNGATASQQVIDANTGGNVGISNAAAGVGRGINYALNPPQNTAIPTRGSMGGYSLADMAAG